MKLFVPLIFLSGLLIAGCASQNFSSVPGPSDGIETASIPQSVPMKPAQQEPIVTPDTSLAGKVVEYNSVGRFVVLSFPSDRMPKAEQTLFVYRGSLKVGEVKISGEQRDNYIVADLVNGMAQPGDEAREQ